MPRKAPLRILRERRKRTTSVESDDDSDDSDDSHFQEKRLRIVESKELNLSEDSSSDSETSPPSQCRQQSSTVPTSNEDISSPEKPHTSEYFDFSEILKSQQILKEAAKIKENQDKLSQSALSTQTEADREERNVYVSSLLEIGEKSTKHHSNEDGDEQNDNRQAITESVEIKIQLPQLRPSKKQNKDRENALKKYLNSIRRDQQIYLHKAGLLIWLGHGFYINSVINSDLLKGLIMSMIPSNSYYPPAKTSLSYIEKILKWFHKTISVDLKSKSNKCNITIERLQSDIECGKASSPRHIVVIFVSLARVLGLQARYVMSLLPPPLRPPTVTVSKKVEEEKKEEDTDDDDDLIEPTEEPQPSPPKKAKTQSKTKASRGSSKAVEPKSSKKSARANKTVSPASKGKTKPGTSQPIDRKVLSSDDEVDQPKTKPKPTKIGFDTWAEIYAEDIKKWVTVDVVRNGFNSTESIYMGSTKPMCYAIAWNEDDTIKDLTRRYSPQWLTLTKKRRVCSNWWNKVLKPWAPLMTKREKAEDKELGEIEENTSLPSSVSMYKDHPHYALQRHLLKFEAIYPPDAVPLGYVRNEPVYSRVCVVELHSKETWMREGKTVKTGESPYKIVKARPKYDKASGTLIKDLPLELFGYWQVTDYIAPPAKDGIVPRNSYGNVELYQPSMLPAGTVHLQIPGVVRIAKKLNIDCAPALVGWDYHGGSSHPVIDGVVVCSEYQDVLLDAWNQEIDESSKRSKEKVQKKARKNWRRLIRAVIVKRRLEKKYNFNLDKHSSGKT